MCCPSRASLLTGLYQHNTGVRGNLAADHCASPDWQRRMEHHTFASPIRDSGYATFYAGKYLDHYGNTGFHVPPGWDEWAGLVGSSGYSTGIRLEKFF